MFNVDQKNSVGFVHEMDAAAVDRLPSMMLGLMVPTRQFLWLQDKTSAFPATGKRGYVNVWMVVDEVDPNQSGFGTNRKDAERAVMGNRKHHFMANCIADGWAKQAIKVRIPAVIARILLQHSTQMRKNYR